MDGSTGPLAVSLLQQRIRGIRLRVDVAALPRLLRQLSSEWTWRQIGQSEEEAQARARRRAS
ncbi:hypothetical protein [Streptomyces goshikiensis]|uniref:hypothetical protein n=1 Tax=Streptomyces goshikiensis TaxID=1942 RepID=UPI0036C1B666